MFKPDLVLTLTATALLAAPGLISATPIFVEYDTHVADTCTFCTGSEFHPGDRVSGWLKIDTDRAPPDPFADDETPGRQISALYWKPDGPDFISGRGWQAVGWGQDAVGVVDDSGRPHTFQGYAIWDYSNNRKGGGGTILELQLYSEDLVDDFISGKGLVQSFDSADLKGDVNFRGRITKVLNGVHRTFDLVLDRLSVTPGQCRAP